MGKFHMFQCKAVTCDEHKHSNKPARKFEDDLGRLCRYQQNELRSFLEPDWLFETHNHRARPIGAVFSFVKFRSSLKCLLRRVV